MTPILLNDWRFVDSDGWPHINSVYKPCISGILAADHPRNKYKAGDRIETSAIVDATDGRIVTTRSGTRYELGVMCEEYRARLAEYGCACDPASPIRIDKVQA
jgi:hypothetical protein